MTPHLLPILDGKVIDLRDGSVRERLKEDYFSFECPVTLSDNTDHAKKFFMDIADNDEEIYDLIIKELGYAMTGFIDSRCFFIWYNEV